MWDWIELTPLWAYTPDSGSSSSSTSNKPVKPMGFFPKQAKANILYGSFALVALFVGFFIFKSA